MRLHGKRSKTVNPNGPGKSRHRPSARSSTVSFIKQLSMLILLQTDHRAKATPKNLRARSPRLTGMCGVARMTQVWGSDGGEFNCICCRFNENPSAVSIRGSEQIPAPTALFRPREGGNDRLALLGDHWNQGAAT